MHAFLNHTVATSVPGTTQVWCRVCVCVCVYDISVPNAATWRLI